MLFVSNRNQRKSQWIEVKKLTKVVIAYWTLEKDPGNDQIKTVFF